MKDILLKTFYKIGRYLCRHRGGVKIGDMLVMVISALEKQLENVNFDIERNGELRVLKKLKLINPQCVFDVGANKGDWSQLMSDIYPLCKIHAFEIVPSTYNELLEVTKHKANIVTNNFGLSDENGIVTISCSDKESSSATAFPIKGLKFHEEHYVKRIQCEVKKAVDYLFENKINIIDFLKVDVEGMDLRVLKGFEDKIQQVRVIQFEYGIFNISSHDLLIDFYSYLKEYKFVVGKIFPRHVKFFEYDFNRENFYGSNYLAVKNDEESFIKSLSKYGT